jgi:hypothetical protein
MKLAKFVHVFLVERLRVGQQLPYDILRAITKKSAPTRNIYFHLIGLGRFKVHVALRCKSASYIRSHLPSDRCHILSALLFRRASVAALQFEGYPESSSLK